MPKLGSLPGAGPGAQITNQDPELSLKFRTGSGAMAIREVALTLGPFLDANGSAKKIYVQGRNEVRWCPVQEAV